MRDTQERPITVVWIDSRAATIVRYVDDELVVERVTSDVPVHHRGGVHVRHDPGIRPGGGGGTAATSDEPRRLQHLAHFLGEVVDRLPEGDLELLGPGTVHERLAAVVRARDPLALRHVTAVRSSRRTDRQLVARLRDLAGRAPVRRDAARAGHVATGRRALAEDAGPAAR